MSLRVQFKAHLAAVCTGSLALLAGSRLLDTGPVGFFEGVFNWLGGIVIVLALAATSFPAGLAVRWVIGLLPAPALIGAVFGGVAVGLCLLPFLHPALLPCVSWDSHALGLVVLHSVAGALGGVVWFWVERPDLG